jgi:NADPH2:quinone reductase
MTARIGLAGEDHIWKGRRSMKIVAVGHGSPVTMLREVPSDDRLPGAGEVAIDVRAAAVNPKDEDYARMRDRPTEFPLSLGVEAAGVVTAVGSSAVGPLGPIREGDEVIAYRIQGAYASRIVVPSSSIIPKPTRLSWAQAGSLMLPSTTAFHCLSAIAIRPGDTVLVHGAAGAVGRFAVQLAILGGAKVVGTVSEKDVDILLGWGATPVGRGAGLVERVRSVAQGEIAAVVDTVGTDEVIDASLSLVGERWRIATIVNLARARQDGFQALGGESGNDEAIKVRDNARYVVAALAQSGTLEVNVDRCFPLSGASEAHEMARKGGAGRLVLTN